MVFINQDAKYMMNLKCGKADISKKKKKNEKKKDKYNKRQVQ